MTVFVAFGFVARVRVIVGTVITGMIMRMGAGVLAVLMGVFVLMHMFVAMSMSVFMNVCRVPVCVAVGMRVFVIVTMHVGMFVVALHSVLLDELDYRKLSQFRDEWTLYRRLTPVNTLISLILLCHEP
jgi:hypothetical protein